MRIRKYTPDRIAALQIADKEIERLQERLRLAEAVVEAARKLVTNNQFHHVPYLAELEGALDQLKAKD
jgi:hypothetical protein